MAISLVMYPIEGIVMRKPVFTEAVCGDGTVALAHEFHSVSNGRSQFYARNRRRK